MPRIVFHIDFDYFYAQIEEVEHPESRGKPLVVCMYSGRSADSGAVATANYEARKYGVKAGIPIFEARAKLQGVDAPFLPVRHDHYTQKSVEIMELLQTFCDVVEPASIDEAYLDASSLVSNYSQAEKLSRAIQAAIFNSFHLTCSIGIGPNKLIAKMASDIQKPNGLTIITAEQVQTFLDPLPVDKIPGIGPKSKGLLARQGISTIRDLRTFDPGWLLDHFGKKTGAWLIAASQGQDEAPVSFHAAQKQLGRIATLKENSHELLFILRSIEPLISDLQAQLQSGGLRFEVVGIYAVDERMGTHSKSKKLGHPSSDAITIRQVAGDLFTHLLQELPLELRRVGVRVEKLARMEGQKKLGEF